MWSGPPLALVLDGLLHPRLRSLAQQRDRRRDVEQAEQAMPPSSPRSSHSGAGLGTVLKVRFDGRRGQEPIRSSSCTCRHWRTGIRSLRVGPVGDDEGAGSDALFELRDRGEGRHAEAAAVERAPHELPHPALKPRRAG